MAPYFQDMGVDVPIGGMISYNVSTGALVARLSEESHEILDTALAYLYRHENHVAITRDYLSLLGPLSDEARASKVLNTGFMPDPLISSYISRIKEIENPVIEADVAKKLFPDKKLFPETRNKVDDTVRKEIKRHVVLMKKRLAKLLQISIERLEKELDDIDTPQAEQGNGGGKRDK